MTTYHQPAHSDTKYHLGNRSLTNESRAQLAELYAKHAQNVRRALERRCGSDVVAQEITAITFEQAALQFLCGKGETVTAAWLHTVARRRLIDSWRRNTRTGQILKQLEAESTTQINIEPGETDRVNSALRTLPLKYQQVLHLRYALGFSVQEVADLLALSSYKATESLLHRARRALSDCYER